MAKWIDPTARHTTASNRYGKAARHFYRFTRPNSDAGGSPFVLCEKHAETQKIPVGMQLTKGKDAGSWTCDECRHEVRA